MISKTDRTAIRRVTVYERWTAARIRNIHLEVEMIVAEVKAGSLPEEDADTRLRELRDELLQIQAKTMALKYEVASGLSMKALGWIVGSMEKEK